MAKKDVGYSIAEAADALGVSRQYIYQLVAAGKLVPIAVMKPELRITAEEVAALRRRRAERQARRAAAEAAVS